MAATIFPFTFLRRGFVEYLSFRNAVHEQSAGRRTLQKLHAAGELVVRGSLLFPNKGGSWADFEAFWNARFGGYEAFLYQPQNPGAKAMTDAPPVEDAAQKDFAATRRYVDVGTLVVRKNGVLQTLGVHYSVVNEAGGAYVLGTSTTLVVRFTTAPGLGATITFAYDFYVPVRFEGDDLPDDQELEVGGAGAGDLVDRTVNVRLREAGPGWSYSAAPNAL